ncbi:LysM peptidoglycan-binding domain-containing protein [Paenibacillus sp. Marseille-Q4541]|uniref:LysM peptidoglycan-binding domain-containing protein n=1 Tax=Paenibacillus sp. Marseille-Q4541 TaxID=2831522 RepID=UPI001BAB6C12
MRIHIVKEGDTLYFLSKKYNVSLEKIISANPEIANPNQLSIGMKVKIPSVPVTNLPGESILHQHKVVQGDSLWKLSKAWGVSLHDMIAANPQLKNPNALMVGETVYIPSGSTGTHHGSTGAEQMGNEENLAETTPSGQEHTGKKNTAPMPNYPQLPELPEMPEMPVMPKAEMTKPKPPKAEMTKPKPTPPKAEVTKPKPKPEPPKEEVKKPVEPAPMPEVKPIAPPPPKPMPLPAPKPEMIKPIPLPVPMPPMKKPEYEPKKEEYYMKKEDCNDEYMNPYQNKKMPEEKVYMDSKKSSMMPVYDKGMYEGNAGWQHYQKPYEQNPMGNMNYKKHAQPMPYVQQQQNKHNMPHHPNNGEPNQPYTTYEHGGYIVNYALVDVPSYGDCGCGHAKPLPYSYMQAEADWKAATAQNAQPLLHPQAYGHNPQYTNYFRPTEYGVQAPYYNPNYENQNVQSGYEEPSFQLEDTINTAQTSGNTAELQQEASVELNGLNQLPMLEEEKTTIQKNKGKANKVKKAVVSSNKRKNSTNSKGQSTKKGKTSKKRNSPWIKL